DKLGRKIIYFVGFIFMALGLTLYPYARVFGVLVLFRLIYELGAAAGGSMLTAVLGDYACPRDRGKASGLMGIMSGLGAVFSALLLLKVPSWLSLAVSDEIAGYITFGIVGVIGVATAVLVVFGLKGKITRIHQKKSFWKILKEGLWACKDPTIVLSYGSSFMNRANTASITTFISLWVNQAMIKSGAS